MEAEWHMGRKRWIAFWLIGLLFLGQSEGIAEIPAAGEAELAEPEKFVALTFDDGPKRETTATLLDGLRQRGASATFFLIGSQIAENQDLVERMKAEGHQVGNHTWNHVRLGTTADAAVVSQEIQKTDTLLRQILGEGTYWLRPPYGAIQETQKAQIPVPMVTWTVDSRDWESLNTEKVVQEVLKDVKPNSIILMHDIFPTSIDAALRIVDVLQAKGYWFVTVEELLALNGVTAKPGVLYRKIG